MQSPVQVRPVRGRRTERRESELPEPIYFKIVGRRSDTRAELQSRAAHAGEERGAEAAEGAAFVALLDGAARMASTPPAAESTLREIKCDVSSCLLHGGGSGWKYNFDTYRFSHNIGGRVLCISPLRALHGTLTTDIMVKTGKNVT